MQQRKWLLKLVDSIASRLEQRNGNIESAEDVFTDILSRLSTEDIKSFKSVSKYWRRSMRTKYFAKQQLAHSRKRPFYIYCPPTDRTMELFLMRPGNLKLMNFSTINPPERGYNERLDIISSFNGLICCINHKVAQNNFLHLRIWICNPSTGETLLLPQGTPSFEFQSSVRVAYDSNTSDYKVFRVLCVGKKYTEERSHLNEVLTGRYYYAYVWECEVYSSSTGTWKNIGPLPCVPANEDSFFAKSAHVFLRQKFYWIVYLDKSVAILSVDLEGRFEVIKLPKDLVDLNEEGILIKNKHLINLRGSLSLIVLRERDMDIWVWKEDGKESSWELVCKDSIPVRQYGYNLAITSSENEIIFKTEERWCSYDVDTRIWKKGKKNKAASLGYHTGTVFPFTKSILPCKGGVEL